MTNHERFKKAFSGKKGQVYITAEIKNVLHDKFPEMKEGSMLPNDHGEGNKSPCWCSGEEEQIFNRIDYRTYKVR